MIQEDKELLLKDLCARLPYGVYISPIDCGKAILIGIKDGNPLLWDTIHKKEYDKPWDIEYIKPYLRPMSSMTEEEKKEYDSFLFDNLERENVIGYEDKAFGVDVIMRYRSWQVVQWLLKHHLDFNGLIDVYGLALKAPEGMYKLKAE